MEKAGQMKCESCGVEAVSGAKFCQECGRRFVNLGGPLNVSAERSGLSTSEEDALGPKEKFQSLAENAQLDDSIPEEQLWTGGYSAKAMLGIWLSTVAVSVIAVILGAMMEIGVLLVLEMIAVFWFLAMMVLLYRKLHVHYQLTSQRFIHKSGILKRVTDRIEVIDIDDVTYAQGLLQRLLGVGTIKITSSDRSHPELWLHGIDGVQRVAGIIDDIRRQERRRRGLHIEAI